MEPWVGENELKIVVDIARAKASIQIVALQIVTNSAMRFAIQSQVRSK